MVRMLRIVVVVVVVLVLVVVVVVIGCVGRTTDRYGLGGNGVGGDWFDHNICMFILVCGMCGKCMRQRYSLMVSRLCRRKDSTQVCKLRVFRWANRQAEQFVR